MRMILDAVDKRALHDQVSFGLTLVVHLGFTSYFYTRLRSPLFRAFTLCTPLPTNCYDIQ